MQKAINLLFQLLFFILPFIFLPITSELFEFNKIITVYTFTILILACWASRMIFAKKIIFRKTRLDFAIIIFLITQVLATIFSIDIHTSIFGYYSRFNGSLLSTLCYVALYWAYVSNIDIKKVRNHIYTLSIGIVILAIYGILEHFGVSFSCFVINGNLNTGCFVQDVKNRVFATLGQPNWLAAYAVATAPLLWHLAKNATRKNQLYFFNLASLLVFLVILFTKSRSGLGAYVIVTLFYIIYNFLKNKRLNLILFNLLTLLVTVVFITSMNQTTSTPTTSEPGGTESGQIRQIVWQGAFDVFLNNPIVGTGVETFAYSYYEFRPIDHNLTSEWEHLYNKAHNEYLNILANTGILGFLSYSFLVIMIFVAIAKSKSEFRIPLQLGFTSLLITNFFGFSVVNTSLLFFIFPAMSQLSHKRQNSLGIKKVKNGQKLLLLSLIVTSAYLIFSIIQYWYADVLYAKGKNNSFTSPVVAIGYFYNALLMNPREAIFYAELANSYSNLAFQFNQLNDQVTAFELISEAENKSLESIKKSPHNVNLYKMQANLYIDLASIDSNYYEKAMNTAVTVTQKAPTDPSGYYTLGLIMLNLGNKEQAAFYLEEAIKLKPDYKNARMTLGLIYIELKEYERAKTEFSYILEKIAPSDELARKQLEILEKMP